jgi:hypothetical protein
MIAAILFLMVPVVNAGVATFDDLALVADSYHNDTPFTSADAHFSNNYNASWGSWDGFAYSNMTDTTTAGYGNQYSAITGSGVNSSANYGVSYGTGGATISYDSGRTVDGMYVTNTTYAYLSMRDGDAFAKQFEAGDWFKLSVTGLDSTDTVTGTVDFLLADGTDLVDTWTWLDLTGLGSDVKTLAFALSSTDNGTYGMNTPAYFALDDVTSSSVPIPGALWLLSSGCLGLLGLRRKRS